MTTYHRPGVFIEETLLPLADSIASSSDSIAAFVGTSSKGGPLGPTLITSWSQYLALFGNNALSTDDLGYAVYSFFNNGGSQCYVVRAVNTNATSAKQTLLDTGTGSAESSTPKNVLDVTAKAPGSWASAVTTGIYVTVSAGTSSGRFNLTIEVGQGTSLSARETFVDVTLDPSDSRNAIALVNSSTVGSDYVTLALNSAVSAANKVYGVDYVNPAVSAAAVLATTAGSDGTGSVSYVTAAQSLANIDANLTLNVPGVSDSTALTSIINWAVAQGNVFVVVDGPAPALGDTAATQATALTTLVSSLPAGSRAAVYGPYLYVQDRLVNGALRLTAPGGAVMGQYARSDAQRGVQKTPAGTGTALRGVVDVTARFDNSTLDTLNQKGVNVVRAVPGSGICIMGGRTLATGSPDRYLNIRRALMFIERDIVNLTRWAIFEPNDSDTWDSVAAVISQYLTNAMQEGLLLGNTPDQAFYVICDETNNDASTQSAGVINVQVGVALSSPAEFIIIRIGQFDGGATVTEA